MKVDSLSELKVAFTGGVAGSGTCERRCRMSRSWRNCPAAFCCCSCVSGSRRGYEQRPSQSRATLHVRVVRDHWTV